MRIEPGLGMAALAISFVISCGFTGYAQEANKGERESIPSGIAWYGILADGLAEAKASNRPIFLLSAAPQCGGAPGMW